MDSYQILTKVAEQYFFLILAGNQFKIKKCFLNLGVKDFIPLGVQSLS